MTEGMCQEFPVYIHSYQLTGRTIPGMAAHGRLDLIPVKGGERTAGTAKMTNGRFYFDSASPGEYYLRATINLPGHLREWMSYYYPGVTKEERAVKIRLPGSITAQSFDFKSSDDFPLVPVTAIVESPNPKHPIQVAVVTQNRANMIIADFRSWSGTPTTVFGTHGESLGIHAEEFGNQARGGRNHCSNIVWTTPLPGMSEIHIVIDNRLHTESGGYCTE